MSRQSVDLANLRRDEVSGQLAAAAPNWFLVRQLDASFAEAAGRLDDPRFATFRYDWDQWLRQLPLPSVDLLAAAARSASSQATTVSRDTVEPLWRQFRDDLSSFEDRLRRLSNDQGWNAYLQLAKVQDAVRDLEALRTQWESIDALPERWRLAALMWPQAELQQAALSFDRLAGPARTFADPNSVAQRQAQLVRLAELLSDPTAYRDGLPPAEVAAICHWLRQRGSDLGLVEAVERRFVHPNLVLHFPHAALPARLNSDVNESFPVDDVIAGTRVRGTGRLEGRLSSRFVPRVAKGSWNSRWRAGPRPRPWVPIAGRPVASTGVTQLRGTKLVLIDVGGMHPCPPTSRRTRTSPTIPSAREQPVRARGPQPRLRNSQPGRTRVCPEGRLLRRLETG